MTREELKAHCERQIEGCEMWARFKGEEPHGKVYEEHKLILELLEQESVLDKLRANIELLKHQNTDVSGYRWWNNAIDNCLHEIDALKAESELQESKDDVCQI